MLMTNSTKRQLIKALAYNPEIDRKKLKKKLCVTDDEIDSVKVEEVIAEQEYYMKMGYLK